MRRLAGEGLKRFGDEGKADGMGRNVHLGEAVGPNKSDPARLRPSGFAVASPGLTQIGGIHKEDGRSAARRDGNEETFGNGLNVEEAEAVGGFESGNDGRAEGVVAAEGVADADDRHGRGERSAKGVGEGGGGVIESPWRSGHGRHSIGKGTAEKQ